MREHERREEKMREGERRGEEKRGEDRGYKRARGNASPREVFAASGCQRSSRRYARGAPSTRESASVLGVNLNVCVSIVPGRSSPRRASWHKPGVGVAGRATGERGLLANIALRIGS
jgi:hypothetical protein